ncbi:MAG: hypothetical protein ACRERD_04705 [Candidatus Binatia bacterium]
MAYWVSVNFMMDRLTPKHCFAETFQMNSTEETEVLLVPVAQLPDLVRQGQITHALVVTAFYWYDLWRRG